MRYHHVAAAIALQALLPGANAGVIKRSFKAVDALQGVSGPRTYGNPVASTGGKDGSEAPVAAPQVPGPGAPGPVAPGPGAPGSGDAVVEPPPFVTPSQPGAPPNGAPIANVPGDPAAVLPVPLPTDVLKSSTVVAVETPGLPFDTNIPIVEGETPAVPEIPIPVPTPSSASAELPVQQPPVETPVVSEALTPAPINTPAATPGLAFNTTTPSALATPPAGQTGLPIGNATTPGVGETAVVSEVTLTVTNDQGVVETVTETSPGNTVTVPGAAATTIVSQPIIIIVEQTTNFNFNSNLGGVCPPVRPDPAGSGGFASGEDVLPTLPQACRAACKTQFDQCSAKAGENFQVSDCEKQQTACNAQAAQETLIEQPPQTITKTVVMPPTETGDAGSDLQNGGCGCDVVTTSTLPADEVATVGDGGVSIITTTVAAQPSQQQPAEVKTTMVVTLEAPPAGGVGAPQPSVVTMTMTMPAAGAGAPPADGASSALPVEHSVVTVTMSGATGVVTMPVAAAPPVKDTGAPLPPKDSGKAPPPPPASGSPPPPPAGTGAPPPAASGGPGQELPGKGPGGAGGPGACPCLDTTAVGAGCPAQATVTVTETVMAGNATRPAAPPTGETPPAVVEPPAASLPPVVTPPAQGLTPPAANGTPVLPTPGSTLTTAIEVIPTGGAQPPAAGNGAQGPGSGRQQQPPSAGNGNNGPGAPAAPAGPAAPGTGNKGGLGGLLSGLFGR